MYVDVYFRELTFGSHKGKRLSAVDTSYLRWMLSKLDAMTGAERAAVTIELMSREEQSRNRHGYSGYTPPPSTPPPAKLPAGVTPDVVLQIISAGRQQLAKRMHPDAGGDTRKMQIVNMAADYLEATARALAAGGAAR